MAFSKERIHLIVNLLKWYNLFLILASLILFIIALLFLSKHIINRHLEILIFNTFSSIFVSLTFFIGLHKRRLWAIPTIIVLSFFNIVALLFLSNLTIWTHHIARIFYLCLSLFQIYFFTRKEVQQYFGKANKENTAV